VSIAAHSSTDVPIARLFAVEQLAGLPDGIPDAARVAADAGKDKQAGNVAGSGTDD
jgi:sodium/hydrogen antiporter